MNVTSLTDAEFVIFGVICEQPLHGYMIENQIKLRNKQASTDLAASSIYYILGQLEEKRLIHPLPQGADSESDRSHKIYQALLLADHKRL